MCRNEESIQLKQEFMVKVKLKEFCDEILMNVYDPVVNYLIMKQRKIKGNKEYCLMEQRIKTDNKSFEVNQRKKSNL